MDTIFTLGDPTDEPTKLNLDDLYERKQQQDLNTSIQIQTLSTNVNVLSEKVKQLSSDVDPIKQKIKEFEDVLKK